MSRESPTPIGWREWVALPDLGVARIKAKVDTGARSSALHAFEIVPFTRRGRRMVRFKIHPEQRSTQTTCSAEAPLVDERHVRNSGGIETLRPVIETTVDIAGERFPIELTLVPRDAMSFRMLLGRQAVRNRFVVNPGRSYLGGKPGKRARATDSSGASSRDGERDPTPRRSKPKEKKKTRPKDGSQ